MTTYDHLQPTSVHDVRLQCARYVRLVAAHVTVQVRSQNSNPQDQERYITTARWRLTFAQLTMLAGGRVRDDANVSADCGGDQRIAGACASPLKPSSQPSIPTLITGIGDHALLHCSAASLAAISTQDPVASSRHAWAE